MQHSHLHNTGVDPGFGQGGTQVLRLKVANAAKWSHVSKVSNLHLGPGRFWVFNAQICILPHSREIDFNTKS